MSERQQEILKYIENKGQISAHELGQAFSLGGAMIHRHLKNMLTKGYVVKTGTPPKVFYSAKILQNNKIENIKVDQKIQKIIDENFSLLEPTGFEIDGFIGFVKWCKDRNYNVEEKSVEYVKLIKEYDNHKIGDFINATEKVKSSFRDTEIYLDELYYLFPYSLPVFGKTKIGQWLFHAKQTQNKKLMKKVLDIVVPLINKFIIEKNIKAISFVPPSVPRSIQFMKELQKNLNTNLPIVKIEKIKTEIIIQQKSLKDIKDRIVNAEATMYVVGENKYENILIADDFTGSGSTLNVIAEKMKNKNMSQKIIGLTITGSMKSFEVVKEI